MQYRVRLQHLQPQLWLQRQRVPAWRLSKHTKTCTNASSGNTRRFAIVGGGFAGVAAAYYLAASASISLPVAVHLYDLAGLGSGGSGAAGGLLHPFSPKGKLLWKGQDAFETALDLISAAEHASQQHALLTQTATEQFVWRQDILRPAADVSQAAGFEVLKTGKVGRCASVQAINHQQARALLPGLNPAALPHSTAGNSNAAVALLLKGGLVLHPEKYLRHLWQSCERLLAQLGNESKACLRLQQVHSLADLEQQHGHYDAIVVAAGAAAATLPEVGDVLPLRLSQGYGLELVPGLPSKPAPPTPHKPPSDAAATLQPGDAPSASQQAELTQQDWVSPDKAAHCSDGQSSVCPGAHAPSEHTEHSHQSLAGQPSAALQSSQFPTGAPSLVGATYMGVQGGCQISVGATKQFGFTAQQALQDCGRQVTDAQEILRAEALLRPRAEGLWEPASSWQVSRVRSGVRALPQKTIDGALPLAGKLPSSTEEHNWWIVGGLGARGLVYHAWLGKLIAEAILQDSEDNLPSQLLRWKSPKQKQK